MMWVYLIVAAAVAIPLVIEVTRKRMNDSVRENAPGQSVRLSQGVTHYQWRGPEKGPVAVCIHGLTTPSFVWEGVAAGLVRLGFRVLTYDLYGRGWSDRPWGSQNAEFFNRQLSDLLENQQVKDDITLIGYSMGGAIATAFAARRPLAVRQVILIAPAGLRDIDLSGFKKLLQVPVVGTWLMLLFYPGQLRKGIKAESGLASSVENISGRQEAELDRKGFVPAVASSLRGIISEDLEAAHATLQQDGVPVLAIWGGQDEVIPLESSERLGDWNPTAQSVVVSEGGHGIPYTHTSEVLDHIARFTSRNG